MAHEIVRQESVKELGKDRTRITKLVSPIENNLVGLSCLESGDCADELNNTMEYLVKLELPGRDLDLKHLRKLRLNGCSVSEVPESLGCLTSLETLNLSGNNFEKLPISISKLSELQYHGFKELLED
ncbi:unnamed protein product [Dovyalis caffra]|uniref:Disease resistance R13L4/SHOC-2-like LRR domain-containing protein n=1 Tax=Dovyalis caffra TaxID=77055 RepID=A0AAV1R506_9ROSI|nr:unnamed protein product [Dovyalis caffra]